MPGGGGYLQFSLSQKSVSFNGPALSPPTRNSAQIPKHHHTAMVRGSVSSPSPLLKGPQQRHGLEQGGQHGGGAAHATRLPGDVGDDAGPEHGFTEGLENLVTRGHAGVT